MIEHDDNGDPVRLVRCERCGGIVARVYGDREVRFYVLNAKTRNGAEREIVFGYFTIDVDPDVLARASAQHSRARCGPCGIGYDLRDVDRAARVAIRNDQRNVKTAHRFDTL